MKQLRCVVLTVTACVLTAPVPAQAQTPGRARFTVEEMLKLRRVSDPQLSPDGRYVAYVVTDVSLEKNRRVGHLWVVPVAGGEPVALVPDDKPDTTPRWSPDGKTLAFLSTRDDGSQVWAVDMSQGRALGKPRQVTTLATEVSSFTWSPDGRWLAFASDVYPTCSTVACNKQALKDFEDRRSKARVFDQLLYRHWVSWKEGRFSHLFLVPSDGAAQPRDLTPGVSDVPPFSLGGPDDYGFSPDSKEIAFARKADAVEAISTNSDLFLLDVTNPAAEPRKITTNTAADNGPAYSPDGRYIAYRAQQRPGFEADRWQLMLYDRKSGEHRSMTAEWDRSVDSYSWTPDSKALNITAEDSGDSGWFILELNGRAPTPVVVSGTIGDIHVTADGQTVIYTRNSIDQPTEIYRASARDGSSRTPLTRTNPSLATFKLRPAEKVWFEGAGGTKIQAWVVKPADFAEGRKYPLLYLVHGGPQNSWHDGWTFRWNAEIFAAAGYVVFMPNPRGSTGFGQQFTDDISGDWGGKVYEDLMRGADYAEALPYVDKGRTGAAGASYGGYMMDWFLGHTTRFRAIVTHAGVYNLTSMYGVTEELWFPEWDLKGTPWTNPDLYARLSPHTYAKNFKTPTLVTHGELDFRVPIGEGLQLFTALQRQGVPSKMVYFPDEGHWINKPANSVLWYHEFIAWMDRWLK
jgi:dipeptidyl aminopeptidase/acylaminoacyl peptidase